jgi:tetratricopeptide (TPR) repeat protein
MKQGQFKKAIEKFEEFESEDVMLSSVALGAIGDCNLELKNTDEAIKYYIKAADKNPNTFTTPIFLKKAGMAYEFNKKYSDAVGVYERIQKEYGKTQEGRDIVKYITRAKLLGNL